MKKIKNSIKKSGIIFIIFMFCLILNINCSKATNELEEYIKNSNIDVNNITEEAILETYEQFAENYSTEEMLNLIEENKDKIKKQGISESTIETGKQILKTTDEEEIKEIIKENVNPQEIKEKLEKGYTLEQIVTSIVKEMPTEQKINTATRLILSNQIVRLVIGIVIILFIYNTILRAIIYHKAGKKWFAAFIPIYRQITMYQICDLSLGYMFLWLVPIIGWIILFFIAIMKRIYLSQNFGKGVGFGIGLIVLSPIFQSILAFDRNIQYIQEDER